MNPAPKTLLLLGYSDIARRRILPALAAAGISNIDIGSESAPSADGSHGLKLRLIRGYEAALSRSDAALVYVSTVNSRHTEWAERALRTGRHVIVDKPACLSVADAHRLVELACANRLCFAEANVYAYHPRFEAALNFFRDAAVCPTHIVAEFRFPPMPAGNYRYRRECGGGALWDLGAYAVSPARHIFGEPARELVCASTADNGEVDTGFALLGKFGRGRSMIGSFGFTTAYVNRLSVTGDTAAVELDRAFSPPADASLTLRIRTNRGEDTRPFAPADTFALFLADVLRAVAARDFSRFYTAMLSDAAGIERLRASAGLLSIVKERTAQL